MSLKELVQEEVKKGSEFTFSPDGALYSMSPAETMFGFTYHASMIPPFKPEHALILGYGGGTIAELVRKVWGQVKVTGIDIQKYDCKYLEYKMKVMDAYEYVKSCTESMFKTRFDFICVDLWDGKNLVSYVRDAEFAIRLKEMCKRMVCLNTPAETFKKDLKPFYDYGFEFERHVQVDGNIVSWWSVTEK